MLAPTHLVLGQAAYLGACLAAGHTPAVAEAWTAAACSLLPALDKRNGLVGRLFPFISEPLEYHVGHRALTRSLAFTSLLALVLWLLLPSGAGLAVLAGYASHPVADMMTPAGVAWFWPARARCVLPGNERYRMRPMGWGELAFALLMGAACVPLLALAQVGEGTGGLIKTAIGNVAAARAQYDANKGRHAWTLRLEGRDNRTYEDVGGEYYVIGPWGEVGFILETVDGPRSVCRAPSCDWYADHAVLVQGDAETTTTVALRAARASTESLRAAVAALRPAGRVYLLGTLTANGIKPSPPVVKVTGDAVALAYAGPPAIATWPPRALRTVDLLAQVRHAPGREVPKVTLEAPASPRWPPLLERWIE